MDNRKKSIKTVLIFLSVALAVTWIILLLYGIFVQREKDKIFREKLGHEYSFSIKNTSEHEASTPIISQNSSSANTETIKKTKISIFISNLGSNKTITEKAMKLHPKVTLGFMPYNFNDNLYNDAITAGFEVFLYMPFEPEGYPDNDPGQYPILAKNGTYSNIKTIRNLTKNFYGYTGVYGSNRENLSNNSLAFAPIVQYLFEKNKLVFLGKNYIIDKPEYLKQYKNVITSDVIIDIKPDINIIEDNIRLLISKSKSNDYAIGYVTSFPLTLDILEQWIPKFESLGIEIVTISNLIDDK